MSMTKQSVNQVRPVDDEEFLRAASSEIGTLGELRPTAKAAALLLSEVPVRHKLGDALVAKIKAEVSKPLIPNWRQVLIPAFIATSPIFLGALALATIAFIRPETVVGSIMAVVGMGSMAIGIKRHMAAFASDDIDAPCGCFLTFGGMGLIAFGAMMMMW